MLAKYFIEQPFLLLVSCLGSREPYFSSETVESTSADVSRRGYAARTSSWVVDSGDVTFFETMAACHYGTDPIQAGSLQKVEKIFGIRQGDEGWSTVLEILQYEPQPSKVRFIRLLL